MKAFVIYLPGHEHSEGHVKNYMIPTLLSYGIQANLFEGTPGDKAVEMANKGRKTLYPYSIKNRKLTEDEIKKIIRPELYDDFKIKHHASIYERTLFNDKDKEKLSRPGVIGCFLSHCRLWEMCVDLNEPIMIFEDDVKFFRNYEPVEFHDVLIISLGKNSFYNEPYKSYLENPTGIPKSLPWKNFSMPGTSGYIIKPEAARALIKYYRPYWTSVDNAMHSFVTNLHITTHLMGRNTLEDEGNVSMAGYKGWRQNL